MDHRIQPLFVYVISIAAFVLSGCSTVDVRSLKPDSSLKSNEGLVAVRIADASLGFRFPFDHVAYVPDDFTKNEEAKRRRTERIENTNAHSGGTFVAPLPAGQYSLSYIYSSHMYRSGNMTRVYRHRVDATPKLGTFTVEPNGFTNLGTIVYYPRFDGKTFNDSLIRNDLFHNAEEYIKRNYPQIYTQLENPSRPGGWDKTVSEEKRRNDYIRALRNPLIFDPVHTRADGSIVFLSRLGTIVERGNSGEWTIESIPSPIQLLAYDENSHGARVVAGEFNILYHKASDDSEWNPVPLPEIDAVIAFTFINDSGTALVAFTSGQLMRVFRAETIENPKWKEIVRYAKKIDWWWPEEDTTTFKTPRRLRSDEKPRKIDIANGFRYRGHPTVNIDRKLYRFSRNLSNVENLNIDRDPELIHTNGHGQYLTGYDTSLSTLYSTAPDLIHLTNGPDLIRGAYKDRYLEGSRVDLGGYLITSVSHDDGASWTKLERTVHNCEKARSTGFRGTRKVRLCSEEPRIFFSSLAYFLGPPHFWNPREGFAFVYARYDTPEARHILVETHDGGQSWTRVDTESFPTNLKYCKKLIPEIGPGRLLLECRAGHFYLSEDGGQSWKIDREPSSL